MKPSKLLLTTLTLIAFGVAVSAWGQTNTIIEQSRIGGTTQVANGDFVFTGFTSTTTGNHTSAPGIVTNYSTSSRIAATGNPGTAGNKVVISPNGGHGTITGTTNSGTLVVGATYQIAVSFNNNSTAASPDVVVTNSDTGTSGLDTFAGTTSTAFQSGSGYNTWNLVGTVTIASANPTFTFAYFGGVSGRWNVDSVRFLPVAPPPTAQYWDSGGSLGGTGTWDTTSANWNPNGDGSGVNQAYIQTSLADFRGTAGTVTIAPGGITSSGGLEFDVNNYVIAGDSLTLDGSTGPGTNITVLGGDTATINSVISGASGLCNAGPGTLVLGATNNLAATVTLTAGTLSLGSFNQTFTSLAGVSSGTLALVTNTLTVGDSTSTTFGGSFTDSGAATPGFLVKQGPGVLTLTGTSTNWHGTTTVNNGAVSITSDTSLGAVPATIVTNAELVNGGRLDFGAAFTLNANRGIDLGTGGGMLSTGGSGTAATIAGPITGSGSLTIPSGSFDLKASNSYSGGTVITLATVDSTGNGLASIRFDADSAIGTGSLVVSPQNGHNVTLRTFTDTNVTVNNPIQLNAFSGVGYFLAGATASSKICTINFAGPISGNGAVTLGLTAALGSNPGGTVILSGTNTNWSGAVLLSVGNLGVGSPTALGTAGFSLVPTSGSNIVLFAATSLTGASAITNPVAVNSINGPIAIGGSNNLELAGPIALFGSSTISVNNTASTIFSGGIGDSTPLSLDSLTLAGTGALTLSGASTYDGGTMVSSGTLMVNNTTGSGTGSGAVNISSGAILAGTGIISGMVTVSGAISPGNGGPGTLTTADENWTFGGSYNWNINKAGGTAGANPGWSLANINGVLTLNSPFTLNVNSLTLSNTAGSVADFNNTQNYSWKIAHATGGTSGFTPGAVTINTAGFANSLGSGTFTITTNATDVLLNFVVSSPLSIANISVSTASNTVTLSGANGPASAPYRVLSSTNILTSVTNWTQIGSSNFGGDGSFNFNGAITPADAERFYIIVTP